MVLRSNHLHIIVSSSKDDLSGILLYFKKYTPTKNIEAVDSNAKESRKRWLLWLLKSKDEAGKEIKQFPTPRVSKYLRASDSYV